VALIAGTALALCCGGIVTIGAVVDPLAAPPPAPAADTGTLDASSPEPDPTASAPLSGVGPPSTSPSPGASPSRRVETRTVTETQAIPFRRTTVRDPSLPPGVRRVRTKGVPGVRSLTYEVTLTDGVQTGKRLLRQTVTRAPMAQVVAVGVRRQRQCHPNYSGACVPIASDVDCEGGDGNGPAYVAGPVRVTGADVYRLDRDGDGVACDD
jgi:hypothetical protein